MSRLRPYLPAPVKCGDTRTSAVRAESGPGPAVELGLRLAEQRRVGEQVDRRHRQPLRRRQHGAVRLLRERRLGERRRVV